MIATAMSTLDPDQPSDADTLWTQLPPDTQTAPRDNASLASTGDLLFLFRIANLHRQGCRWLAAFRDGRQSHYLARGEDGTHLNPMTGTSVEPPTHWRPCGVVKMATIRKHARGFWSMRMSGENTVLDPVDGSLSVDGIGLVNEGVADLVAVAEAKVRWPDWALDGGDDRILDHFNELDFFRVDAWAPFEPGKGLAICPLDGPVQPIHGSYSSPQWTWTHLCGRNWGYDLCPKCLGAFSATLDTMN